MKRLLQIIILTTAIVASGFSALAQKSAESTSSARAAYGSATADFKTHSKKNRKVKKKARKSAKRSNNRSGKSTYWSGRPY